MNLNMKSTRGKISMVVWRSISLPNQTNLKYKYRKERFTTGGYNHAPLLSQMEEDDFGLAPTAPAPALVSLLPFSPSVSPSPRRLSSNFTQPSRPVRAARQLAWVDLRGRLVGAEECSSARAIGSGLRREEAVAWELFSPIHRILIVAVIAVAATESKKNHRIMQLNKSVQTRVSYYCLF